MAWKIDDSVVEELAAEVALLAGENTTQAVRVALRERRARLTVQQPGLDRATRLQHFLTFEAWPITAPNGPNPTTTKAEREEILGYD